MKRKILQILGRSDWLRFGLRDRIIRYAHNPDTSSPENFTISFYGATYKGNFDNFIDWSVFYYGAYAKEELRLFDDFLQTIDNPVVADVGANIGHHTLFAASRSAQVISFEPFLDVAKKLEQKIADNNLSNVVLFKNALGEKNETATYAKPKGHNAGTGSFLDDNKDRETLKLPIRVGDEVFDDYGINDVHFIKIDVEGFEPYVLRGLSNTLTRCRPIVFFEWSQNERKGSEDNNRKLFPPDYTFFQFVPDTVFMYLFRKPTYRLSLRPKKWDDGNLLALPNEYIDRIKSEKPFCSAAEQIIRATEKVTE